jgi:nucleoside-diphosphate-sugar epimerase
MRKILVTGASGFIGRNLLPTIVEGDQARTLVAVSRRTPPECPPNIHWVEADLSGAGWTEQLPREDFDAVIHLAQSRHFREFPDRAVDIFNVNVKATVDLADWALRHGVKRFIFASTGSVYSPTEGTHHEDDRCAPETMYAASKLSAEMLLRPFSQFMDVLVLRLFCVYGPGQTDAMVPGVIQRFLRGEDITLAQGVGVRFTPIYVDDCSSVINQLLVSPRRFGYQVLNVAGLETINLKEVASLLEELGGRNAFTRATVDPPVELVASTEKLRSLIEVDRGTAFIEGLCRTVLAVQPEGFPGALARSGAVRPRVISR